MMNFPEATDFVNRAHELNRYRVEMTLSPQNMSATNYAIPKLKWSWISYGKENIEKVPDNKRGIYAFAVNQQNDIVPPHNYIMYIGIAGRKANRSLRERYRDYLTESKIKKRAKIARMIIDWEPVLKFYYAPVEDHVSSDDLIDTERKLNTALMPPCSVGDLEGETKQQRRAFF